MKTKIQALLAVLVAAGAMHAARPVAGAAWDPPTGAPAATIDLASAPGLEAVHGQWRYSDARVVEVDFRGAGSDGQPTGPRVRTYDIEPRAGGMGFDDSGWAPVAPESLTERRGNGRLSFGWYRIALTVPERVRGFDVTGATAVFETSVDDYAEIWVDGEIARGLGQAGGSVVGGWNAANRLVVGRNLKPGQRIQLAVFAMNGPVSNPPTNFLWMRYARLEFHPGDGDPIALEPREVNVEVIRFDPSMDAIVGANPKVFKLAEGFDFTEGPVWVRHADGAGHLLFSDPNRNRIYRYSPEQDGSIGALSVFRHNSGYAGPDIAQYHQPGSNGLAVDAQGRLTINEHGNRRVSRVEDDGAVTVLADRFTGHRLNSPNDLVYRSDGTLFFTDPPFGLPRVFDDPGKELEFSGVFSLRGGKLTVLDTTLRGPNGIALSPDERHLYVGNWDDDRKLVMRYDVAADGTVAGGVVFADLTAEPGEDAIDGVKVDRAGNVYVSGPGGLWIFAPDGRRLGVIVPPLHPHNMAWGDADGRTLYLTARSGLYRMRLDIPGFVSAAGSPDQSAPAALRTAARIDP